MERTILVAEDSPTQAERLRLLLEGQGYRVEMVANGREGLERVQSAPPDLIISDVVMPVMDGYAFCQAVKFAERTRRIPFVLLTERNTPADFINGLQHGADNFITKPFEDDYLLERLRRIFENLELRRKGHLDVEITLSAAGRQITINADKQQMIELLFATLEELVRANGRLEEAQRIVEDYARSLEARVKERTRQLKAELDARERLTAIIEATTDLVGIADLYGRLLYLNHGGRAMLGIPPDEDASTLSIHAFHPEPIRAFIRDEAIPTLIRNGVWSGEIILLGRDGREIPVSAVAIAHRSRDGTAEFLSLIARNLTERKQMEASLRQSEKLAAMGSLLAGVAHELNNPLGVVLGQAALLQHSAGSGPLAERAEQIAQAAKRCGRIVQNFLAMARQRPIERQRVTLNQVIKDAVELIAYPLRVNNVEVQFDLDPELPILWADPHQLHQAMVNLLTNADYAMREIAPPRRITLTTRHDPAQARVHLEVADTGPGIPPEIRTRIFEPFFTTKPPGQGTGLGLSLCHGIVASHGGTIRAENPPGPGALFVIELPVEAPPETAPEARVAEKLTPIRGKRILVVDDEPGIARTLAEMLALDGHQVETAPNGVLALAKLGARAYDVILSDLKMPELDGPGLYREVARRWPALCRRFVFLTGDTLGAETEAFLEQSRAPSLTKPFELPDVRQAVQRALGGA